jgi:Tfp pilus assembly PilM family ATPase
VETQGRKLIKNTQINQTMVSGGELEEKVSAEVKLIEIIALFKGELRKTKIEAREAVICLSGRDLIIRTFEMPMLPREELQNAINFEAKKYIPFKVEDLISSYQLEFDKTTRTNRILFIGIKKETMDRYNSILSQLNIKIKAIEYSGFSVLRSLALAGVSDRGIIGVLGAELNGEDEVNFTVLENGFPLFSRDISLTGGPGDLGNEEGIDRNMALEKLKMEMRVSLDYYNRKFPNRNIQKVFFISNQDYRQDLEGLIADAGLSARFIDISRIIKKQIAYSLSFIKGYSSSLSKAIRTKVKVNILATKIRSQKEKTAQREIISLFEGLKLDSRVTTLAFFLCSATFGFGLYRSQALHKELNNIIAMRSQVGKFSPGVSYEELNKLYSEHKKKSDTLDNLIKRQLYLTEPLSIMARIMPPGAWLKDFAFNKKEDGKAELVLSGAIYLADNEKEFSAANAFLAALKANPVFSEYFKEINLVSLDSEQFEGVRVTDFSISCKTYTGKK